VAGTVAGHQRLQHTGYYCPTPAKVKSARLVLEGQAKLLREYAERNGFEIVKAFEGVESVSECKGSFEKFISLAGNEK
jgi:hypothetical protein